MKLSTFRLREKLYRSRRQLKDTGYAGVYINEDLTKFRSGLLYSGRKLAKPGVYGVLGPLMELS